jgi:hypothetical protein
MMTICMSIATPKLKMQTEMPNYYRKSKGVEASETIYRSRHAIYIYTCKHIYQHEVLHVHACAHESFI